jgi:hypothetical protein
MKKIIILQTIILSAIVSCSTDDEPTYKQELRMKKSNKESDYDFSISSRDTIGKYKDTLNGSVNPKPIKP